jgi:hypothetical protein
VGRDVVGEEEEEGAKVQASEARSLALRNAGALGSSRVGGGGREGADE